jgi:hypothetical protein
MKSDITRTHLSSIAILTFACAASLSLLTEAVAGGNGSWVVWSQPQNTNWAIVPSYAADEPLTDIEIADDFELIGTVSRVVAGGYECFNCAPPDVAGAYVRFYQWTPAGPGQLDAEYFLPDSDPRLLYSPSGPATLDIELPQPFAATGKHFVSVQLAFNGGGSWYWWITNLNNPSGNGAMTRDRSAGPDASWSPIEDIFGPISSDVTYLLWGDDGNPPPPGTDPCGPWSVVASPDPAGTDHAILRDVFAIAPDDVWAVGEYTTVVQGSLLVYSLAQHWDGSSWTIVPSPNPTPCTVCTYVTFDAVAAAGPNDIWAAGGKRVQGPDGFVGTHIYVARYNGSSWTVMNTPLTVGASGSHVQDIEIIAPDDIWFFGDYVSGSGSPGLAMHWNGSNFTIHTTPNPAGGTPGWGLEGGSALSSNDIWAVGGGSDGDYTNKGYILHWDGSSWTRVLGPTPGTYQRLYAVKAIAPDDVWAVGDYFIAGSGYFPLFLHWDGSSWTQVTSPGGGAGLVAFDSDNIYSGGAGIVHWDGSNWEHVESFPTVLGASVASISASTLCDMWAVGREIVAGDLLTFTAHLHPVEVGEFTTFGDLTDDGVVSAADLGILLGSWGVCPGRGPCAADLDQDGDVDAADLAALLGAWTT